jgi:hypothetical protein
MKFTCEKCFDIYGSRNPLNSIMGCDRPIRILWHMSFWALRLERALLTAETDSSIQIDLVIGPYFLEDSLLFIYFYASMFFFKPKLGAKNPYVRRISCSKQALFTYSGLFRLRIPRSLRTVQKTFPAYWS